MKAILIKDGYLYYRWNKYGEPTAWIKLDIFTRRILLILLIIFGILGFYIWSSNYLEQAMQIYGHFLGVR